LANLIRVGLNARVEEKIPYFHRSSNHKPCTS